MLAKFEAEQNIDAQAMFAARVRRHAPDGRLVLNCPKEKVAGLADWLIGHGAEHVAVAAQDYVFSAVNPLYEKLASRLQK